MDKDLEKLMEVGVVVKSDEIQYMDYVSDSISHLRDEIQQHKDEYNQFIIDSDNYHVNVFYNKQDCNFIYTKEKKKPIGFGG